MLTNSTLTVTTKHPDNLSVFAQDWPDLTNVEDKKARSIISGNGTTITSKGKTKNTNDVVFNFVAYGTSAYPSPSVAPGNPLQIGPFLNIGISTNAFAPYTTGGYQITSTAGLFTNSFLMNGTVTWASATMALKSTGSNAPFDQSALTDYTSDSQLYLNRFPGYLYDGANTPSSQHDSDGKNFAAQVQPLDAEVNPSSTGSIGVVGIGISNFAEELCTSSDFTLTCDPNTFLDQASHLSGVNPSMKLVDCAQAGAYSVDWDDQTLNSTAWTTCFSRLSSPNYNLTPAQVEVVMFEGGEKNPAGSLAQLKGSVCPATPNPLTDPDACVYESYLAGIVRVVKSAFPNVKQIFLQPRIFAGYAAREPYSYEVGFATKWLIQAQVNQIADGTIDPLAGDLGYTSAAWLGWSAYTWGPGPVARDDKEVWLGGDYEWDGVHPSQCRFDGIACGRSQSASLMMNYYTTSPYTTPWFLAPVN